MLRLAFAALVGLIVALGAPVADAQPSFGVYDVPLTYTERVVTSQFLTMRDGVRIAVSIARPARNGVAVEGRFPVVWTATLNIGSSGPERIAFEGQADAAGGLYGVNNLVGYGYVVATVARRGSGASFGSRRGYQDRTEAGDSYEINEWLAAQSWSTGAVGMVGCSNTGEAVLHTMTTLPPSLRAVFMGCFSWNKFDGFTRGGIIANWGTGPTRTIEQDMTSTPVQGDEARVLLRQAAEEHQHNTNLYDLMRGMPFRDSTSPLTYSRFWAEGSGSSYAAQLRSSHIAVYIMGGWHDDFRREGLVAWSNLPNHPRIVIGPWMHCRYGGFNMAAEVHRFFDTQLKGIDTGIESQDAIHYYTINAPAGQEWRSANVWPLPNTRMQAEYLVGAHRGGALSARPVGHSQAVFPVRTDIDCPHANVDPSAYQPCHVQGAGASFTGPVLADDTEITGHPIADLWISSSTPDARVFAYLEEVAPDGGVTVVTEGRLQASLRRRQTPPWNFLGLPWMRSYAEDAEAPVPGQAAELVFDMLPASYVFRRGYRMQITVTGADWRERGRPDSGPITLTLLNDAAHRSFVRLPIIPSSAR